MRPFVEGIFKELLVRHRGSGRVHLNDIAEVIGRRAVTYDEVEHLINRLEAEGLKVGEPLDRKDISIMKKVLTSARRLRESLKRAPTVMEVAADAGLSPHLVRRSLEYGQSAARRPGTGTG